MGGAGKGTRVAWGPPGGAGGGVRERRRLERSAAPPGIAATNPWALPSAAREASTPPCEQDIAAGE